MKRRTVLSMVAGILTMLALAWTAGAISASAQQNLNCCTYVIDVSPNIPASCFPITIVTEWGAGIQQAYTVATNGLFFDNIWAPCPPAPLFNWAQIPGGPPVPLGGAGTVVLANCTYTLTYVVTTDTAGCIYILLF